MKQQLHIDGWNSERYEGKRAVLVQMRDSSHEGKFRTGG